MLSLQTTAYGGTVEIVQAAVAGTTEGVPPSGTAGRGTTTAEGDSTGAMAAGVLHMTTGGASSVTVPHAFPCPLYTRRCPGFIIEHQPLCMHMKRHIVANVATIGRMPTQLPGYH